MLFQAECTQHVPAAVWHTDEVISITEPAVPLGLLPKASRQHETGRERMCGQRSKSYFAYDRILIIVSQGGKFYCTFSYDDDTFPGSAE